MVLHIMSLQFKIEYCNNHKPFYFYFLFVSKNLASYRVLPLKDFEAETTLQLNFAFIFDDHR